MNLTHQVFAFFAMASLAFAEEPSAAPRPPQSGRPQFNSRPQSAGGQRPQPPRGEPNGNREGGNERHFPSTAPRPGGFRRRFGLR